jgi:hypothetical protein
MSSSDEENFETPQARGGAVNQAAGGEPTPVRPIDHRTIRRDKRAELIDRQARMAQENANAQLIQALTDQVQNLRTSLPDQTGVLDDLTESRQSNSIGRIGVFSGTGENSFQDFVEKFDLAALARGMSPEKKLKHFPLHLTSVAFDQFRALPAADKATYDVLVTALKALFMTENEVRDQTRQLHQAKQGEIEKIAEFAARLRKLARSSSYRNLAADALNCILKEIFCQNVRSDLKMLMSLSGSTLDTFEEAIVAAKKLEANEASFGPLLRGGERKQRFNSQIYAAETGERRIPSPNRNYSEPA